MGHSYGWTPEVILHDVDWPTLLQLQELIQERERHEREFEASLHDKELAGGTGSTAILPGESWDDYQRQSAAYNSLEQLMAE